MWGMMSFAIALETYGQTALLELVGELDMAASPTFSEVVGDQLGRGSAAFVVDLDKLTYIDSRGLYALIEMLRSVRNAGGDVAIVLNNPQIARVFAISGIDSVFRFFPNRPAAFASVAMSSTPASAV